MPSSRLSLGLVEKQVYWTSELDTNPVADRQAGDFEFSKSFFHIYRVELIAEFKNLVS